MCNIFESQAFSGLSAEAFRSRHTFESIATPSEIVHDQIGAIG